MPPRFSLLGGPLRELGTKTAWENAFATWLGGLRDNRFYRSDARVKTSDIWCFKWLQGQSLYELITRIGYGEGFDLPGVYLWLRDEGGSGAYDPIYVGISFKSMKKRFSSRYIPSNLNRSIDRIREPKQFEIVSWFGEEIRRDSPTWRVQRAELAKKIKDAGHGTQSLGDPDRLEKAERFARATFEMPYFTFHPLSPEPFTLGNLKEMTKAHEKRLRSIEDALIILSEEAGYEILNERRPKSEPDWKSIG